MSEEEASSVSAVEDGVAAWERTKRFVTCGLLKEGPLERTELVEDEEGRRFVRKYLRGVGEREHPYERIVGERLPFIPEVHEAVRVGDELVVVSDYIEGESLEGAVEAGGPLEAPMALAYTSCLCDALEALHGHEGGPIVHRDVSPGNVIVNAHGAWLVDFGIARTHLEGSSKDTRCAGTPGFAAPEQYGFAQTDARTDVYALGELLDFMLVGSRSREGGRRAYDARIAEVVERATSMDSRDRFSTVAEMREALFSPDGGKEASRNRVASAGFQVFRICFAAFAALSLGVCIVASAGGLDAGSSILLLLSWALLVALPCLVSTDLFGVVGRIPFFSENVRWRKAGAIVASVVVCILCWLAYAVLPA